MGTLSFAQLNPEYPSLWYCMYMSLTWILPLKLQKDKVFSIFMELDTIYADFEI